jgi:hypothetical protein
MLEMRSNRHAKKDCPESGNNNSGNNGQPSAKCSRCGKEGHTTENCWYDPTNASKRPDWMKNQECRESSEVSNIVVSRNKNNDNFELLCCAVCDDASHMQNTVNLIDDVESKFELPNDIIIEKIFMEPIITPATETPTVATRETKPEGDDEDVAEHDEVQDEDVAEDDEVQVEEAQVAEDKNQWLQDADKDVGLQTVEIQDEDVEKYDEVQVPKDEEDNAKVEDDVDVDVQDNEFKYDDNDEVVQDKNVHDDEEGEA